MFGLSYTGSLFIPFAPVGRIWSILLCPICPSAAIIDPPQGLVALLVPHPTEDNRADNSDDATHHLSPHGGRLDPGWDGSRQGHALQP